MHHEYSIGPEDLKEFGTFSGDLPEQDTVKQQVVSGELPLQDLPTEELNLEAIRRAVDENAKPIQEEPQAVPEAPIRNAGDWARRNRQAAAEADRKVRAAQSDDDHFENFSVFDTPQNKR